MPIKPQFAITQTDTHINLEIRVPHVRVTSESVQVAITDDSVLHFASPPYLLVLEFAPQEFHETADESCATYEPTIRNGVIQLLLKKKKKGQWENLDLLGRMVPNKKAGTSRWLREVKGDDTLDNEEGVQQVDDSHNSISPIDYAGYGFRRMFHGIFTDLARDGLAKEMLEMPWEEQGLLLAESSIRHERREQRFQMEARNFGIERYLGDLEIEDDYIYQCATAMESHWQQSSSDGKVAELTQQLSSLEIQSDSVDGQESFFSSEERLQLMSIPYPLLPPSIQPDQEHALFLGLLDIIFAYVYDHIVTDGDPTVESAWTITILSPSLSWLEDWLPEDSVQTVAVSSLRRALIHPYIRNYDFAVYIMTQVTIILRQGIRCVLRCLLKTRTILDRSEMYYLGNKLYLDPYLAWVQAHAATLPVKLASLAETMEKVLLDRGLKGTLGFDLKGIEATAREEGDEDSSSSESEDDESDSSADEDSSGTPDRTDQFETPQDEDGQTSTKTKDARSTELLDSNLGKSILAITQTSPEPAGTGSIILDSEPTKKPLIEEID